MHSQEYIDIYENEAQDQARDIMNSLNLFKISHKVRIEYILNKVKELSVKNVIDVGCGWGVITRAIDHLGGVRVIGVDISPTKVCFCSSFFSAFCLDATILDKFQNLGHQNLKRGFDMVICGELIEHVDTPKELVQVCHHLADKYVIWTAPAGLHKRVYSTDSLIKEVENKDFESSYTKLDNWHIVCQKRMEN